jgi:hypothetical protein
MPNEEANRVIELRNAKNTLNAVAKQMLKEFPEQKWYPGKVSKLLEEHKELVTVTPNVGPCGQTIDEVKDFIEQHSGTFIKIERCYKPPRPGRPHLPRQRIEVKHGKEKYVRSYDRVHYKCRVGHYCNPEWRKIKDKFIIENKFLNDELPCAECRANHVRLEPHVYHEYAELNGGKCLASDEFFKKPLSKEKVLWQCSEGHQWEAPLERMHNQESWCPECAVAKNAKSRLKYNSTTAMEYAAQNDLTILNKNRRR